MNWGFGVIDQGPGMNLRPPQRRLKRPECFRQNLEGSRPLGLQPGDRRFGQEERSVGDVEVYRCSDQFAGFGNDVHTLKPPDNLRPLYPGRSDVEGH